MATSVISLLEDLTASLHSAEQIVPEELTILPNADGLSLLTTKNELFLSYIQNLVFLILHKIDQTSHRDYDESAAALNLAVVEKLAELRLLLEKGIKPLEGRLKYQVDKVLRAADDATRPQDAKILSKKLVSSRIKSQVQEHMPTNPSDVSEDGSDVDSDGSDSVNELAYRPNPAALLRPSNAQDSEAKHKDGIYKPPKITPTTLPVTMGKEERTRRPAKSAALDEFIATDLSTAPMAEPSIGSTIRSGGRHTLSQREREEYVEKTRYEEENFTRLPKDTKRDRAKGRSHNTFGGEEWKNLGAGLDRIDKLTKRSSNSASMLARSRKRAVQDGPRDSGEQPGSQFAKRRRQ